MGKPKKIGTAGYELIYPGKATVEAILSRSGGGLEGLKKFRGLEGHAWSNLLIHGDNVPALKTLIKKKDEGRLKNSDGTEGVRLIYIDPPFSTNLEFRGKENQKAYDDKIVGAEFIEYLRRRLVLLRELLSGDGSIYVHLDWKKAHHVKVIMDEVFGEENFLNDIIWSYGGRGAKAIAARFSRNHDIILWYRKGSHIFNRTIVEKRIKKGTPGFSMDEEGRWFKTSPKGDYTQDSIAALKKEDRVYKTKNGKIRIKYFVREDGEWLIEDKLVGDVWEDIPDGMHISAQEKTGYPTQKPEALLSRIIKTSSNPGDIVLDCFCGSGTALAVSEKLGRRWVGIDSGRLAIDTARKRLLSIERSKDIENNRNRYSKKTSPFALIAAGDGQEKGLATAGDEEISGNGRPVVMGNKG